MGGTSGSRLETAQSRNGLVNGARPWSRPPHRSGVDVVHWQRWPAKASSLRWRGNGRRAKAAVMRHGCWRGNPSKGPNRVAGTALDGSTVHRASARSDGGPRTLETRRTPGRQRGATNPQPCRGENRRGGEKPRGRNESQRMEPLARRSAPALREWTQQVNRWRGESGQDHERRNPDPVRRIARGSSNVRAP
jgi:hypothetical protein